MRHLLILWLLLILLPQPLQAKLNFGLVPGSNSFLGSEKVVLEFAAYLAEEIAEEVSVQVFSNEKTLHEWLNRYRMIDLAVLSNDYLANQLPGEFFPLVEPVPAPGAKFRPGEQIVARQGINPWVLRRLQNILCTLQDKDEGRAMLKRLGIIALLPSPTRSTDLAASTPDPVTKSGSGLALPAPSTGRQPLGDFAPRPDFLEALGTTTPSPSLALNIREKPRIPAPPSTPGERPAAATDLVDTASYAIQRVADNIYAAISKSSGYTASNAFFAVGPGYVVAGGAHMTSKSIGDLLAAIRAVTDKPLRHFILTHHHAGHSHADFDFPPDVDLLVSMQTWKALESELTHELNQPFFLFGDGLTLRLGNQSVVLTTMGRGHTEEDILVFFPEQQTVFTSDLVFVDAIGYMGDGYMEDWLLTLEFIEQLEADIVIPGFGPVSDNGAVTRFKAFFREMMTEVLRYLQQGSSLEETLQSFSLPRYGAYSGYDQFIRTNVRRAYRDLQTNILN